MRIAVLGTGTVGRTLAGKLVETGHSVTIGSRSATNAAALEWAAGAGPHAKAATFFDAAADCEVIINATPGTVSLDVLAAAGTKNLDGKVLIDVANPLDHSAGFPPSLSISNTGYPRSCAGNGDVASAVAPHLPSARGPRIQHQGGVRVSRAPSPERTRPCPSAVRGGGQGCSAGAAARCPGGRGGPPCAWPALPGPGRAATR